MTAPPGKKMGHAGAIVSGGKGTAAAKMDALRDAGAKVGHQPDRGRRADGRDRRRPLTPFGECWVETGAYSARFCPELDEGRVRTMTNVRFDLPTDQIPTAWFNVLPRLPEPLQPPLHPGTKEPVGPDDLAPLFPMALIAQEVSADAVDRHPRRGARHPAAVAADAARARRRGSSRRSARRRASTSRTSRCRRPARTSRTPRCRRRSTTRPRASRGSTTETGAGQWGTALAFACAQFDLECKVYMVRASYEQKPYRRMHDGDVGRASASRRRSTTRRIPGSLGLAISDAVRDAATRDDTHYSLGSVLNHVLLHQTVIGLEAKEQLALAGETRPDVVIGSCGGGSNLGGIALPFVTDADVRLVAVEPSSCPTLTEGTLRLRLRRHRGHDAAAADVHARPRLHAAVDPRRRPALPRRLADHLACW